MSPSTAAAVDPLRPWRANFASATVGVAAPVVVACSGGADSIALLALAIDAGLAPIAVHVDHGLRTDSADDAKHARVLAEGLGAEFRSTGVTVAPGPNLEARAKQVAGHRPTYGSKADEGDPLHVHSIWARDAKPLLSSGRSGAGARTKFVRCQVRIGEALPPDPRDVRASF